MHRKRKPLVVSDSESEKSEPSPPRRAARPVRRRAKAKLVSSDEEESSSPAPGGHVKETDNSQTKWIDAADDSESDDGPLTGGKKRARQKRRRISSSGLSEGGDVEERSEGKVEGEGEDERDDDIALDEDEPYQTQITETRLRPREEKGSVLDELRKARVRKKEAAANALKRRSSGGEAGAHDGGGVSDAESDVFDDVDADGARDEQDGGSDVVTEDDASGPEDQEDNLDDFIVDDGDEAPLPALFQGALDLSTALNRLVELYVRLLVLGHAHVRSLLRKDEGYYTTALRKVQSHADSVASSLAQSSVWQKAVREGLETYPRMEMRALAGNVEGCDACGRDRTSVYEILLKGPPYDRSSMATIHQSTLPRSSFRVGRFCATRCRTYHGLWHFTYRVYRAVKRWYSAKYEDEGSDPGEETETGGKEGKVNDVLDEMEQRGFVGQVEMMYEEALAGGGKFGVTD
ncbi:hypothetical protein M427DRAFT_66431 [Gonapodya prolifera JEL478]|uniref:DUF4211 domain-containing protein n=1 Tax=Gonapodya prolifera (strain JEL478) TaxID=1344416 RepID=A0A139AUM9_GONPJ|nr:hypothetical protein M427DRAFT_66431 [Gonapodya prolifera JEL478]|eukprot:KXS20417.1 hypothetical protein M427DRAFT_66431 [Gonapodya prolifera JEL478]